MKVLHWLRNKPIRATEIEPGRLGWIDSGEGWWTHRVTGERYLPAPEHRFVIHVAPWVDDDAVKEMARWGGLTPPVTPPDAQ